MPVPKNPGSFSEFFLNTLHFARIWSHIRFAGCPLSDTRVIKRACTTDYRGMRGVVGLSCYRSSVRWRAVASAARWATIVTVTACGFFSQFCPQAYGKDIDLRRLRGVSPRRKLIANLNARTHPDPAIIVPHGGAAGPIASVSDVSRLGRRHKHFLAGPIPIQPGIELIGQHLHPVRYEAPTNTIEIYACHREAGSCRTTVSRQD